MKATRSWLPFVSVLMIISTLFSIVLVHMEIRRMGYELLNLSQQEREVRDYHREKVVRLAELTGPQNLRKLAQSKLAVQAPTEGQIIHIAGDRLVVTH